ncbi:MAG: hypothetical protein IJB79_08720 [Candidatus Gastranaerophilales bacterium]|nr:hypothetical protein [Candidatus Gastranaerophilales bacterium]
MKKIDIKKIKEELKEILKSFETFERFSSNKEQAYKYAKIFKIKICPYCNINYIYTVDDIVRPDFDHFEPKSTHPEKELDANNIIPCCPICNSRLKKMKEFNGKTHLHPFKKDFDSIVDFKLDLKATNYLDEENFLIDIVKSKKAKVQDYKLAQKNIEEFKLIERYQQHKDCAIEILKELKYYHISKKEEINKLVNMNNKFYIDYFLSKVSKYKNIDINNVSLGKLKKDIAKRYATQNNKVTLIEKYK